MLKNRNHITTINAIGMTSVNKPIYYYKNYYSTWLYKYSVRFLRTKENTPVKLDTVGLNLNSVSKANTVAAIKEKAKSFNTIRIIILYINKLMRPVDIEFLKLIHFYSDQREIENLFKIKKSRLYTLDIDIENVLMKSIKNILKNKNASGYKRTIKLAIIMVFATGLRSSEVLQLKNRHVKLIFDKTFNTSDFVNVTIDIRVKKSLSGTTNLFVNSKLLNAFRREFLTDTDINIRDLKFFKISKSKLNKVFRDYILSTNADNRKLADLKLGIQIVRKLNTTLMNRAMVRMEDIAKFNRHSNRFITQTHYDNSRTLNRILQESIKI